MRGKGAVMKLLFSATLTYDPEVLVSLRLAFPVLFTSTGLALDGRAVYWHITMIQSHAPITDDEPGSVGQFVLPSTLKEKIIICESEKRVRTATSAYFSFTQQTAARIVLSSGKEPIHTCSCLHCLARACAPVGIGMMIRVYWLVDSCSAAIMFSRAIGCMTVEDKTEKTQYFDLLKNIFFFSNYRECWGWYFTVARLLLFNAQPCLSSVVHGRQRGRVVLRNCSACNYSEKGSSILYRNLSLTV